MDVISKSMDIVVRHKEKFTYLSVTANCAHLVNPPKIPERIQWVQPKLMCEVAFAKWAIDGELRQTAFLGWRDDKSAQEVVL
jgi:ATP-dependent DNA ligase